MDCPRLKIAPPPRCYTSGLLSLALLFPLAMLKLLQHPALQRHYVLEVNYYSPDDMRPQPTTLPSARQYYVINIDGHKEQDKSKLDRAQLIIRKMLHSYDTVRGIRIRFAPSARYESFIAALETCQIEQRVKYVAYKNELWVYCGSRDTQYQNNVHFPVCGTMYATRYALSPWKSVLTFPFVYDIDAKYWPLGLLLTVLITMTFRRHDRQMA